MNRCKYYKEEEYVSYDGGASWTAMRVYRKGSLIESESTDCGYVPPTPTVFKWKATYGDSSVNTAECDSTSAITSGEVVTTDLVSVSIGDCVTTIGDSAFYNYSTSSGFTSVTIPNSVTSIGDRAFWNCYRLPSITIPNSVTSIGGAAFRDCGSLSSLIIPDSVTSIGNQAFYNCTNLSSITIGSGVTSIGKAAFGFCGYRLRSITVNSNNTSYDSRNNCNAVIKTNTNELICGCRNTIIPSGVTSIGVAAFGICTSLKSIDIPNSVTSIGGAAFRDCSSLSSITIPDSVTSIGKSAFYACSSLTSITIPSSITSIGEFAFSSCDSLQSITCLATTPPAIVEYTFADTNSCPIYVPAASVNSYKSASVWSDYSSRIQAIP